MCEQRDETCAFEFRFTTTNASDIDDRNLSERKKKNVS